MVFIGPIFPNTIETCLKRVGHDGYELLSVCRGHEFVVSNGACGAMDNASDYGSEDSRFESWQARMIFFSLTDLLFTKLFKSWILELLFFSIYIVTKISLLELLRFSIYIVTKITLSPK